MLTKTPKNLASIIAAKNGFDDKLAEQLANRSHIITLDKGANLFREGEFCENFIIVVSGCIKVQKVTADGHEIVLYRLSQGEGCNLTNTCLLGGHHYPAEAVAEEKSCVLRLSRDLFFQILEQQPGFRTSVFKGIKNGISGLLNLVQDVAFGHMDHRLAATLLNRCQGASSVRITHQALATDLGTAREVVSRLLKEFERHGWLKLHRGRIELLEPDQLAKI